MKKQRRGDVVVQRVLEVTLAELGRVGLERLLDGVLEVQVSHVRLRVVDGGLVLEQLGAERLELLLQRCFLLLERLRLALLHQLPLPLTLDRLGQRVVLLHPLTETVANKKRMTRS